MFSMFIKFIIKLKIIFFEVKLQGSGFEPETLVHETIELPLLHPEFLKIIFPLHYCFQKIFKTFTNSNL